MMCECGHLVLVHVLGRRGGKKVRTLCTHQDERGRCECKLARPKPTDGGSVA
jgi:hypothetical protein